MSFLFLMFDVRTTVRLRMNLKYWWISHLQFSFLLWLNDRKASLNPEQSERLIDVFRYCIRKDPYLSKLLDQEPGGFDIFLNIVSTQ